MFLTFLVIAVLHQPVHRPVAQLQPATYNPQTSKVRLQVGQIRADYRLQRTVTGVELQ